MAPEAPIKAPTTVRSCDPSTNPSAHRAHPLDEFNTVITTGVSPPPTARVACAPRNAPSAATYASEPVTDKTRRQSNYCPSKIKVRNSPTASPTAPTQAKSKNILPK